MWEWGARGMEGIVLVPRFYSVMSFSSDCPYYGGLPPTRSPVASQFHSLPIPRGSWKGNYSVTLISTQPLLGKGEEQTGLLPLIRAG